MPHGADCACQTLWRPNYLNEVRVYNRFFFFPGQDFRLVTQRQTQAACDWEAYDMRSSQHCEGHASPVAHVGEHFSSLFLCGVWISRSFILFAGGERHQQAEKKKQRKQELMFEHNFLFQQLRLMITGVFMIRSCFTPRLWWFRMYLCRKWRRHN